MNSQEIESFLMIIEENNFTEAAKKLFVSQATLSHRIFNLERELGFRLIERKKGAKSLFLTDSGRDFVVTAKNWKILMQDIERIKVSYKNNLKLSIGTVDTFHTFMFPPLYEMLAAHEPKITLNLRTYNSAELYQQLYRGELDVAFTLLDLPTKDVISEQIYREPRVVLRRESEPCEQHGVISLKELDLGKEIFFIGDVQFNNWYKNWKGKHGYPTIQVDTAQLLTAFMQQEGAWTLVPLCIARALFKTGNYAYYYLKEKPPERVCYRIQPKHSMRDATEVLSIFDRYLELLSKSIFSK